MAGDSQSRTSTTLLQQLRNQPADEAAWREFVRRYGPKIHKWCRQWNLQPADADDITQNVLFELAAKMRTFHYDPAGSFRAWLKTVTHHAWRDYLDGRRLATPENEDCRLPEALDTVEAREDLQRRLEEEFDQELLEEAMARVQLRVAPHTWEAFRLTALECLSGAEAAPRVGMQVAMVFVAKSKVQKLLRQEIQRLEGDNPAGEEPNG